MKLTELREKIDAVDRTLVRLLNERADVTLAIGKIKQKKGLSVYVPSREKEIYETLKNYNKGPLDHKALKNIYREIMSSSLNLEKKISVAYLGPELTFTNFAALEKFGRSVSYAPCRSITDVFGEVESRRSDYGVVPIENSIEGAVNHTLDMFVNSDLKICAEAYLPISHNLLGTRADLRQIKYVYSKPEVFGQCRLWLETNLPHVELMETSSTAQAALVVSKKKDSACIASLLAKDRYGLKALAKGIEDSPHNVTRFLVIAASMARPTKRDKTSVMFSLKDRVGALHDILVPFKNHRINLTKIESRPSRLRAWKYYFFVDLEGHVEDACVKSTLKELGRRAAYLKILGSYPANG
ncbi:MAG: prephenate dehydratase [Candidatus Omnitrophica bacterium]|nr:prephenate dehydratase [Candidatus Omnitrophota bacterium]